MPIKGRFPDKWYSVYARLRLARLRSGVMRI